MIELFLAGAAGIVLGLLYFAGLWATVRRLPSSKHPMMLTATSFALRALFLLGAFYLIVGSGWQYLVAALIGFLAARFLMIRRIRRPGRAVTSTA